VTRFIGSGKFEKSTKFVDAASAAPCPFACIRTAVESRKVSGIAAPVELYELHAQEALPEWRAKRDAYEAGLAHFEAGRWAEACQTLYPLLTEQPGDYDVPSLSLVGRAIECLKSPPARFDSVLEFLQK